MARKISAIVLAICLVFSFAACENGGGEEPQVPESLTALRNAAAESGSICAAAYLGADFVRSESSIDEILDAVGYSESYDFIKDIPAERRIQCEGAELYCIVPLDRNYKVRVSEYVIDESNDYTGAEGEVLYEGAGDPIIIQGNVSDIMPNMLVTVTAPDDRSVQFSPSLSLYNGMMSFQEGVYDFIMYDEMLDIEGGDLYGDWASEMEREDGSSVIYFLSIYDDSSATFMAMHPGGELLGSFTGTYSSEEGNPYLLTFHLKPAEGSPVTEPIESVCRFAVEGENFIWIDHISGDMMMDELEGGSLLLTRTVG